MGVWDKLKAFGSWLGRKVGDWARSTYFHYNLYPYAPRQLIEEHTARNYLQWLGNELGNDFVERMLTGNYQNVLQNRQSTEEELNKLKTVIYQLYRGLTRDAAVTDADSALNYARIFVSRGGYRLGRKKVRSGIVSGLLLAVSPFLGALGYLTSALAIGYGGYSLILPWVHGKIRRYSSVDGEQELYNTLKIALERYEYLKTRYDQIYGAQQNQQQTQQANQQGP